MIKNKMRIYVVDSYEDMSKQAANIVASQVRLKPDTVLGLATGGTPIGMYNELVKMYREGSISFKEVTCFNLDEYYQLEKNNPQSYYYYMKNNFFDHIDIMEDRINIPNGMTDNINEECIGYEKKIEEAGGIDLQVLGIGPNGHIGFNEPDTKFEAGTHLVKLDELTIKANSRFFKSIKEVPTMAISMGIRTIMQSKKIVLLANGESKARAIKELVTGDITPKVPATILQLHGDVTVIVDKEAALELKELGNSQKEKVPCNKSTVVL